MPPFMTRARLLWALTAAWAGLIFILSSIPGRRMPNLAVLSYDKVLHAMVYGVLGGLCLAAAKKTFAIGAVGLVAIAVAAASFYGLTDEFHQVFVPGRSADLRDAAADAMGALVGACIALGVLSRGPTPAG
jgi:VanZ family protein